MKIGKHDAKEYGAKQLKVVFTLPQDGAGYEWPDGFLMPVELPTTQKCGSVEIEILFRGETRNEIVKSISSFCGPLGATQKLELDGYEGTYIGRLKKTSMKKTASPRRYILTIELDGYMVGDEVTISAKKGTPIERKGSRKVPCTVKITPTKNIEKFIIHGFGSEIEIKNLTAGTPVIISSDGKATENERNKMQDVKMLSFPALEAEETTLSWEPDDVSVTVKYTPAWM